MSRLIPAHAGKTPGNRARGVLETAHPRSRGENSPREARGGGVAGSSPLTRGKRPGCARSRMARRLIPAHAGKTKSTRLPASTPAAHPRSRGENEFTDGTRHQIDGSSPLTRGKLIVHCHTHQTRRLIPAHAGKTLCLTLTAWTIRAHPRSRGENVFLEIPGKGTFGSSPLTRGKPRREVKDCEPAGLIPAHAGKT